MHRTAVFTIILILSAPAIAGDYDQVRERLRSLVSLDDTQISIAESPVPGILQVRLGSEIVYMTEDSRYLLQGRMLDLETREDLTNRAMNQVRKGLMSELTKGETITFGPDDADYDIYVFTDVDCGYCRRLHQQIEAYNDAGIRINYAAYPRAGIGSDSFNKMVSVWCADDQHAAMNLAKAGGTPEPAQCESPVADQYKLGQAMGVTGTPALVTPDGDLIPGYVPPSDLRARLARLAERGAAGNAE